MIENEAANICMSNPIIFPRKKTYQFRAVTYEVTAHFSSEAESLKAKVAQLLVSDLKKDHPIHTIAGHHRDVVK